MKKLSFDLIQRKIYIEHEITKSCKCNDTTIQMNFSQSAIFFSIANTLLPKYPIRFIDSIFEASLLQTSGLSIQTINVESHPSFDSKIFLKIDLFGYLNDYCLVPVFVWMWTNVSLSKKLQTAFNFFL
jgi:hypothetical protein